MKWNGTFLDTIKSNIWLIWTDSGKNITWDYNEDRGLPLTFNEDRGLPLTLDSLKQLYQVSRQTPMLFYIQSNPCRRSRTLSIAPITILPAVETSARILAPHIRRIGRHTSS